jgi:ubiquitin-like protein Pup
MAQTRIRKPAPKKTEEVEQPEPQVEKTAEDLKAESDALLDEIDGLLEEQAEDFVRNYVQKGGE